MFEWFKTTNPLPKKPKTLGRIGEDFAQYEYEKRGFSIIAANFFNKKGKMLGEVDFVAKNESQIIFVEVKTRNSEIGKFGTAAEAVNIFKQRKILKAVKVFLLSHSEFSKLQPSIDVCEVIMNEFDKAPKSVKIIVNAVEDIT